MPIEIIVYPDDFNDVYWDYLKCDSRVQVYFGGSSSGKSVFLAKRAVLDILGGRNYLIVRQVGRTLRGSVFTEILKVITDWGMLSEFTINRTDMLITAKNNKQIIFAGLDDVEKLKSLTPLDGAITDIWVEEATETDYQSVKQLLKRQRGGDESVPKRLTLSFNPILRNHWIYQEYFMPIAWADDQRVYTSPELSILKTTYKDNRFLTADDVRDLENETDKYFYEVYTLGNWGVLGNLIFTNWVIADLDDENSEYYLPEAQRTTHRNGLDFGYSVDPAALIVSHYDPSRKRIYIYDELYQTELTNDLLAAQILPYVSTQSVYCDSSEPKSIAELQRLGVRAVPVKKGRDSVKFGIQWLQQQTIIVHKRCINTQNELRQYKWREDKAGNALPEPVGKNDHLIDALRYAYEADATRPEIVKFQANFY
ncbi:MAG TPA: PBSX family phage terminase large subunit [Bellilinea sp.]|nr:PBSX family phage terminase large subunit [Bellilinea sp.]